MTLFGLTSGSNDVREKVSQLLDYSTQSIDATNLAQKVLYQTPSAQPGQTSRPPNAPDKQQQREIAQAQKQIQKLQKEMERMKNRADKVNRAEEVKKEKARLAQQQQQQALAAQQA